MTAYAYMLSTYEEHGAEEPIIILNRAKIIAMFMKVAEPTQNKHYQNANQYFKDRYVKQYKEDLESLSLLLLNPDEELSNGYGHNLGSGGWGGWQFHVIKIYE